MSGRDQPTARVARRGLGAGVPSPGPFAGAGSAGNVPAGPILAAVRHALAALPGLGLVALIPGLVATGLFRPWLVREDGLFEWLQVALAGAALALAIRSCRRRPSTTAVLLACFFGVLIFSEIDLDRRVLGVSVVDLKFLRGSSAPLPVRAAVAAALAGAGIALVAYVGRHRRALLADLAAGLRRPWGRLFVAGFLLFAAPQMSEGWLNKYSRFPRNAAEETLELAGCLYLAWAMVARDRDASRASPARGRRAG